MNRTCLPRYTTDNLPLRRAQLPSAEVRTRAAHIIEDVRARGLAAVLEYGRSLGDLLPDSPVLMPREALTGALDALPRQHRAVLERSAARISAFAQAHRAALADVRVDVEGGRAGADLVPVTAAGCYAPGGRFPLPSSVLMTALTARAAGVETVVVASPRPAPVTLAAAALAGADFFLAVGGAQAVAAMAFGVEGLPQCDVIVGPGNAYVTAAKQLVSGEVRIDMLAGPSELLALADEHADPALVAADLLAQAEHDPDAFPMLVTTSAAVLDATEAALFEQLATLPTRPMAEVALQRGAAIVVENLEQACAVANALAPEHLAVHVREPTTLRPQLRHFGALFLGEGCAEVFGDYGTGPNHVLPTGGTARSQGGLSVLDFLRTQMWLELAPDAAPQLVDDVVRFARLEGLEAHARAAEMRRRP